VVRFGADLKGFGESPPSSVFPSFKGSHRGSVGTSSSTQQPSPLPCVICLLACLVCMAAAYVQVHAVVC
jgi:hypothetical protein